jgi:hypothetical protein
MGERLLLRCTGSIYRRNLCSLRGLDGWRRDDVGVKGVGMLNSRKPFLLVALAVSMSVPTSVRAEPKAFLGQFCVQCHGEKKPKANLSLHNLTDTPVKRSEIDTWKHVLDKIETGEMPPEGSKRPDSDQRQKMVAAIKGMLKNAGVSLDEARWLAPSRGNWVDHDALFSGKPVDPAATKPRLWRLSGQAYEEFMRQKNLQFKLGIKTYGQGKIRAPWELGAQKEFSDYASSHKIGEADLEYHLRNATRVAKAMVVKFAGNRPNSTFADWIGEMNIVIKAGKSATLEQIKAAVTASFDKVLNRKLDPEEMERYAGFFKKSVDQLGGERGADQFLTAILLRPEVMYRIELPPTEGMRAMLPPRSLARVISLALTDSEPDELLVKAADTGRLASSADVRIQVERILRDRNVAKTRVLRFFQEYFGYTGAMDVFKDETTLAEYGIGKGGWVPNHFVADTDHLIEWILADDKNVLHELLTTPKTFLLTAELRGKKVQPGAFKTAGVRSTLAIYEISISGEQWSDSKPFDMPADHRMGILTHPSWLAAHSTNFDNHAIDRGRWIREKLLGGRVPEIPITVDATLPDEPHKPLRERMRVTKVEYCWQCHKHMDPLGLPFEQYDHFGRYRSAELIVDKEATEQKGKKGKLGTRVMKTAPLDTTGRIEASGDPKLDGPVKDPRELIMKLAKSERVEQVFVRHAFRYFLGRNETLSDGPILVAAHRAYKESGGSMNTLIASLVTSDSFLYRGR